MERQYVSVHALNRYIKAKLDNDMQLQTVYIRGEISNYRPHPSGHMYFTLRMIKRNHQLVQLCLRHRHVI